MQQSAADRAPKRGKGGPGFTGKLLLAFAAVAFPLVVGEIALRLVWHNPYRREVPDHILKVPIQHPNTDYIVDRSQFDPMDPVVRFRTDDHAYVEPSFQYPDPDATVAFLGGSTTACVAVKAELRFPALVSTLLGERGLEVNTLNAARPGGTSHDSLNALLNHVVLDRPDVVVMMHAANDVGVLNGRAGYRQRMGKPVALSDMAKWSLQLASDDLYLAGLLRRGLTRGGGPRDPARLASRHDVERAAKLPIDEFMARLRAFVGIARGFGAVPVLVTQPLSGSTNELTPDWANLGSQDRFNGAIRKVSEEEGVLLVDLARRVAAEVPGWDEPGRIFYDGMHVNDAGSRVYAEFITDALFPALQAGP